MSGLFSRLYQRSIKGIVNDGKKAIEDLASLPERLAEKQRALEESLEKLNALGSNLSATEQDLEREQKESRLLRSLVGDLEKHLQAREDRISQLSKNLSQEREKGELYRARMRLLSLLYRLCGERERERDAQSIKSLKEDLAALLRDKELLRNLHERSLERAEKIKDSRKRLDQEYQELMTEIEESSGKIVEKLVDKGLSCQSILDVVPDIAGLMPQEKVRDLERSIRRHNEEQAALLGLETLRRTPPPKELTEALEKNRSQDGESFFERIFTQ